MQGKIHQPLLDPYVMGDLPLRNRVVMAPLTRTRAVNPGHVPTELMREYYLQRALAGLIISEGVWVSENGQGWYGAPGIYNNWVVADIVRMMDGILVEHWDVIQDEATRESSKSGLPMFGDKFVE